MECVIMEWMLFMSAMIMVIGLLVMSAICLRTRAKVVARENKRLCSITALACVITSVVLGIVTLVVHYHWSH